MSLLKWAWIPFVGLGLVTWGYLGAPKPAPTEIFSTAAMCILAGGVIVVGIIMLVVMYTGEQTRRRAQAHHGVENWNPTGGGRGGAAPRS